LKTLAKINEARVPNSNRSVVQRRNPMAVKTINRWKNDNSEKVGEQPHNARDNHTSQMITGILREFCTNLRTNSKHEELLPNTKFRVSSNDAANEIPWRLQPNKSLLQYLRGE